MEKSTIVAGVTTENTTKSGNNVHDAEGKFTSKDSSFEFSDKLEDDIDFNEDEFNKIKDLDIDNLLFDENEFENIQNQDIDSLLGVKEQLKNIEEMTTEELIKELKGYQTFLKEQGVNVKGFKGLFGGDLKLKCSNLRQMKKMIEQYGIGLNGCTMMMTNAYDYAGKCGWDVTFDDDTMEYTFKSNTRLYFSRIYLSSYDFAKKNQEKHEKTGYTNEADDDKKACYTITHELGHALHNTMFVDYLKNNPKSDRMPLDIINERKQFVADFKQDVYKQYILDNDYISYEDFKKKNSNYGIGYGDFEWFAETFASANCGKPTDVAKSFLKVLQQKGYVKGGM